MQWERWIYKLPLRLRSLFRFSRVENELNEEFEYHLDRQIQFLMEQGRSPEEARVLAVQGMSGLEQQKDRCREARGVGLIQDLLSDSRYALRSFRKSPLVATVIVASLALGIGANAAIFSVINAVSLKMLPVRDPERLVLLSWSSRVWPEAFANNVEGNGGRDAGGTMHSNSFPSDVYAEVKKQNTVFDQTFAFAANDAKVNIELNGSAESAHLQAVSGDFFEGLGVTPSFGREILPADDSPSSPPVAIVSYEFWRKYLGRDVGVSGKTITINGNPATIIGVAPPEFFGVAPGDPVDIYIPLASITSNGRGFIRRIPLTFPRLGGWESWAG